MITNIQLVSETT